VWWLRGNVAELLDGAGCRLGVLTHGTVEGEVIVPSLLRSRLSGVKELPEEVVSRIAVSLAVRGKWNDVKGQPVEEIVSCFLDCISVGVNAFDVVLCCALLGGGVLHAGGDLTTVKALWLPEHSMFSFCVN
jgi:hypothetical protein